MGFFSDLKEDLSQAVNELMPNEGAEENVLTEGTLGNDTELLGNVPTSDDLSDMLEHMGDLDVFGIEEPALAGIGSGFNAAQPEPVVTEPEVSAEPEPTLSETGTASLAEPEVSPAEFFTAPAAEEVVTASAVEEVVTAPAAEELPVESAVEEIPAETVSTEPVTVIPEPEEVNKSINDNGREERKMEIQAKVATDETAVVTEGMSITGDIISGGSLELIGSVTGNIEVMGKLNITGTIHGNSKAAEIFAEGARINGEISSQGSVKIGQSSVVIGNIAASSAVIAGAVKGDIDIHGPIVLDTTAIVMGNIRSKSVQINNGAVIEGLCSQCYADVNPTSFFEDIKKKK